MKRRLVDLCRFWRQVGGHLRLVESNSVGVVWGIGYDHTAWVHTGGDGGGFSQGLASSTDNIYTQVDVKSVYIYENQRWNPVTGYTNRWRSNVWLSGNVQTVFVSGNIWNLASLSFFTLHSQGTKVQRCPCCLFHLLTVFSSNEDKL